MKPLMRLSLAVGFEGFCKPNCKPTTRHSMTRGITSGDVQRRKGEPDRTISYWTARSVTRILQRENRCTGNRTVGSNPTLSAKGARFGGLFLPLALRCMFRCILGRNPISARRASSNVRGVVTCTSRRRVLVLVDVYE